MSVVAKQNVVIMKLKLYILKIYIVMNGFSIGWHEIAEIGYFVCQKLYITSVLYKFSVASAKTKLHLYAQSYVCETQCESK